MHSNRIDRQSGSWHTSWIVGIAGLTVLAGTFAWNSLRSDRIVVQEAPFTGSRYAPRSTAENSGFGLINKLVEPWGADASLEEIRDHFNKMGFRAVERLERELKTMTFTGRQRLSALHTKAALLNYEGEPHKAYEALLEVRGLLESDESLAADALYTTIFLQGLTGLRLGENENCILCRGESSCILPISASAVHVHPKGSRLAIEHFTEYLNTFPDDLEVRWLLNVAHMTLGEYPDKVDPKYRVPLDHWKKNEFDIGRFRDIGHRVGVNHFNQAGGAIMEDFNNDGLLDLVTTTMDPCGMMSFYQNHANGTFVDHTESAGLANQLGGLNCVQTDYNNDGYRDLFIVRGAWLNFPMRPSLLRNNQDGTFTDVTAEAGLLYPANSIAASWADFDNDGWLDVFICCERQSSRLYRNRGNGTFEDVSQPAQVVIALQDCKGAAWIDFDNDNYPDLFLNFLRSDAGAKLFRNRRDGTFVEVTDEMGIDGPVYGFSCWTWDFDNDGWLDIFATCYRRTLGDVVKGLQGQPHSQLTSRLYRNRQGKAFDDVTKAAGLDAVYSTMGSNFADFDNDGFLDMYLGTGEPSLAALIPNRMFKNVDGKRFTEVTASSGTGHLQKGHGVACGDWDRDGNVDLFIEMGGAVNGDKYHNILFQNPGHPSHWLTVNLIGRTTNRAAVGARIKVVTKGPNPQTIFRLVSSGSSFGANPFPQTIGLGSGEGIDFVEISWPTSGTKQVFRDIPVDQAIEITEHESRFRTLDYGRLKIPD